MNTFECLLVEENVSIEITSENRCRNCKKSLTDKKERFLLSPTDELKKKIKVLENAVKEWEISKIPSKKKKKKKKKKSISNDSTDEKFLDKEIKKAKALKVREEIKKNKEIKKAKALKVREEIKKKRILKLWKGTSIASPLWKYKLHLIYPKELIKTIMCLFILNKRNDNIFSLLSSDILIYLLEENIQWGHFSEEKYPLRGGKSYVIPITTRPSRITEFNVLTN